MSRSPTATWCLLAPIKEPLMFFAALAIIAVASTGIVLALRDWKPRNT